jgi:hypothetical protein
VPVFACALILAATWIGLHGVAETLRRWDAAGVTWTTAILFGTLFCISLIAFLLQALQTSLVRLYAGYWPIAFLRKWAEQRQEQLRQKALDGAVRDWYYIYSRNAIRDIPQATRLGNVITAAYDYPDELYGANASNWWSRLTAVLPANFRTQVDGALTPLVALLNLCTTVLVATFVGSVLLVMLYQKWWVITVYLLLGLALARIFYRAAINQAVVYGDYVRVGFDLYRSELLKQMRIPLPDTARKENNVWQELNAWTFEYQAPWQPRDDKVSGQGSVSLDNAGTQSEQRDLYYDNRASTPQADETSIDIGGKTLFKISTQRTAVKPDENPTQAGGTKSQAVAEATEASGPAPAAMPAPAPVQTDGPPPPNIPFTQRFMSWLHRRWMGWIVLLLLIGIGGAEVLWARSKALETVITAKRDLPLLSVIGPADVMKERVLAVPNEAIKTVDDAVGRVTLAPINEGSILTSKLISLGSPVTSDVLQDRQVLSLPSNQNTHISPGEAAIVVGVKADPKEESSEITKDAISLGEQDGRLLLALRPDDARRAATYLLDSRRLVVFRTLRVPTATRTPP